MSNQIIVECSHCKHEMILDELLEAQIAEKFSKSKLSALTERENALQKQIQEFEEKRALARANYRDNLKAHTKQIEAQLKGKLSDEQKVKMDMYEKELQELKDAIKKSAKQELELRQQNNALLQQKETFDLEVARKVGQELEKTRRQAVEIHEQQYKIELLEKEQSISELKKMVENLNRKAHQGSQQQQGETGEIFVEAELKQEFPDDEIIPVPKGKPGGDIIQCVSDERRRQVGKLIIEIKRTKSWSNSWIDKLKNDQREEGADIAVIISETLPDMDKRKFANIDGVWVCDFSVYRELILALRCQLINVFHQSIIRKNEDTKASNVYDYVTGIEFEQTITAIMDTLKQVKDNLNHEKTVMQRSWSKREKLIERISCSSIKISSAFEVLTGNMEADKKYDADNDDDVA